MKLTYKFDDALELFALYHIVGKIFEWRNCSESVFNSVKSLALYLVQIFVFWIFYSATDCIELD